MGGRIWIESELGKGARFIFTVKALRSEKPFDYTNALPETDGSQAENSRIMDGRFSGKRMLIAEDIEINREILISLLENTGLIIDSAENGEEALNMVKADTDKYDIVFMDIQMPVMDGLEATRRIRALPLRKRGRIPIIAITANAYKDDIKSCLEAGMDDHISKPIDVESLFGMLRNHLR